MVKNFVFIGILILVIEFWDVYECKKNDIIEIIFCDEIVMVVLNVCYLNDREFLF